MVSVASFISATAVAVVGCLTTQVQAHGYMLIPLTEFKGTATGAWIVQISPQFNANWEFVADDTELIALYVEKAKEAGYANNIRKLLDSDTNLYGADCGFSNPDAKPKDPPTDGTATFERGLAHHGPCEIWLDDTMVLHNDDCAKAFSVEDYMSINGCMFRFYWLAFQGSTSGKYVWQIYKNCIPLTGPGAGQTATVTNSPVWTNAPAPETVQATVAPFTQNQETQNPVWTATNTPNSYSFNSGNQATNAPETGGEAQMLTGTTAPSFSF
ncbi:hypothetical protein PHYSODRAFT_255056 [Phytophthora sojae]|uniref:Uncharacterized protein n=1 Tax=Phytophthora sojae (strain P6497) TaxID=1094619 RepID=G4YSM1_PHYSP|nr:hypothetical protein PHYSODRAFT_255056 [Phytophthora sojae]EGZ23514.1 hypothetical protein PHYSODRAFT_255056 [Phytophthora sojae]|eukprot:XP_009518802.1 hypothetical protein PHYSODRAFT_255056 [Phytophthora sojae]